MQQSNKHSNAKKRAAKFASAKIDAYAQGVSVALRDQHKEFRNVMRHLPPFQSALAELTLESLEREGGSSLSDVENRFDLLRRSVVRVGKEAALAATQAANSKEATELMQAGMDEVRATSRAD